jgi:cellobiose-specific phosphotransferase system component IIB
VQADQNLFDCLLLLLVGNKHLQAAAVGDCNEQQSEVEVEAAAAAEEEEAMGTLAAALFAPQGSQNSSEAFPQILNTYFFKALAP